MGSSFGTVQLRALASKVMEIDELLLPPSIKQQPQGMAGGQQGGKELLDLDSSEATPVSLLTAALHRDLLCSPASVTCCYLINF